MKLLGWAAVIAFLIYAVNNPEQVFGIAESVVMIFVGIFETIGDAVAEFADEAESATAIHAATQLVQAVPGL
jgi:hypothetical protein